ncbi:MAG: helix-turn-helix domain-containing protein [Planctomycetota bacterium]
MVRPLPIGKRLLVHSPADPKSSTLVGSTADWGCLVTTAETLDELRGKVEGGDFDMVLIEDSRCLKRLVSESDPNGDILRTSLAEVEKRHILRVLSSTQGNKTRAAKVLGIDTKTLYNKLKAYGAAAEAARRRAAVGHSAGSAPTLSRLHG